MGDPALFGSALDAAGLFSLFAHFLTLSLLSIGGYMSVASDMHRFVVTENRWITDAQFGASLALAQAAPGPNVLFVVVIGWNVAGPLGALACLTGVLIPSTILTLGAARWIDARREALAVRVFKLGLAPITVGLTAAAGVIVAESSREHWGGVALVAGAAVASTTTKLNPVVLIGVGAVVVALGLA